MWVFSEADMWAIVWRVAEKLMYFLIDQLQFKMLKGFQTNWSRFFIEPLAVFPKR